MAPVDYPRLADIGDPEVECKWCGGMTTATAIAECHACWELRTRLSYGRRDVVDKIVETIVPRAASDPSLLSALEALLDRYVDLVNCGDCGSWDPETEAEVIEARRLLRCASTRVKQGRA